MDAGAYRRPAPTAGRRLPQGSLSVHISLLSVSFLSDPGLKHTESSEARRKAG